MLRHPLDSAHPAFKPGIIGRQNRHNMRFIGDIKYKDIGIARAVTVDQYQGLLHRQSPFRSFAAARARFARQVAPPFARLKKIGLIRLGDTDRCLCLKCLWQDKETMPPTRLANRRPTAHRFNLCHPLAFPPQKGQRGSRQGIESTCYAATDPPCHF